MGNIREIMSIGEPEPGRWCLASKRWIPEWEDRAFLLELRQLVQDEHDRTSIDMIRETLQRQWLFVKR